MITARNYEEMMQEIVREDRGTPELMRDKMIKLSIDTLDCLGYAAGARIFEEYTKKDGAIKWDLSFDPVIDAIKKEPPSL